MSERAQTTLDFAVGVSLFAAILLFVFVFVPGLLAPFTGGVADETVASNRVVDGVVNGQFGSPAEPGILDRACTVAFFDTLGSPAPAECRYDGQSLQERLELRDGQSVNLTMTGNVSAGVEGSTVLCWDADGRRLAERDSGDCAGDVTLAAGDAAPTSNTDTISATRVASLAGEDVTVEVELW